MAINITRLTLGTYQENAFIVSAEGRDDCVVIDPGDGLGALRRAIGAKKLAAILITHGHFDHTLAAPGLAAEYGAPVYIHPEDREMLTDETLNAYDPWAAHLPSPRNVETVDFGESLSVAGLDFQILHTPGHSRGCVCLYLPGEATLFSGDTLFEAGYGRMDLFGGNVDDMRASLKKLFALPGEIKVWPGHGDETTIARERARYRL